MPDNMETKTKRILIALFLIIANYISLAFLAYVVPLLTILVLLLMIYWQLKDANEKGKSDQEER